MPGPAVSLTEGSVTHPSRMPAILGLMPQLEVVDGRQAVEAQPSAAGGRQTDRPLRRIST